jgi:hypothetical protein
MSNFKKGKHTEKMHTWATPKGLLPNPEHLAPPPAKLPRGYCKRLKGPHQFAIVEARLTDGWFWFKDNPRIDCNLECVGCGKTAMIYFNAQTGQEIERWGVGKGIILQQ